MLAFQSWSHRPGAHGFTDLEDGGVGGEERRQGSRGTQAVSSPPDVEARFGGLR